MSIAEARALVGKRCAITWADRHGNEFSNVGLVQSTRFVPMYGAYLITDSAEVSLDKVKLVEALD